MVGIVAFKLMILYLVLLLYNHSDDINVSVSCAMFTLALPPQKHLRRRACLQPAAVRVLSALLTRLANVAVVLVAVLGSRTAEMSATHNLIIHGPRASKLAKGFRFWLDQR